MFGWLKGKPKIEGGLGYFGLEDWWLSTFSQDEREYIENIYRPISSRDFDVSQKDGKFSSTYNPVNIGDHHKPLTEGKIGFTTQTAVSLLSSLSGWFRKAQDRSIAKRILAKAEELVKNTDDFLDLHFLYLALIQSAYKARETDPTALDAAIEACKKQIAIAPKAAEEFKRGEYFKTLPEHTGYTQLAIIREKQRDYTEAIQLATQAKRQGWNGDWDKRVERCKAKIQKQGG